MIVRRIVSSVGAGSGVVAPVEGISPLIDAELGGGGGGGAITPVDGISPARAMPESAHARTTANVKRFIVPFSPLELRMPVYWQEIS